MFKNPFSFNGRIRRTEYGVSVLLYIASYALVAMILVSAGNEQSTPVYLLLLVPSIWFLWAQGAKRCHDLGNSGWFQFIPLYGFWMLFAEGTSNANKYGENPKEMLTSA